MSMSKPVRWSLIAVAGVLAIFIAPVALFTASNAVGGLLNLLLNRKPTTSELAGDYKLVIPWGNSSLHIGMDGTFTQEIEETGKTKRTITGNWQLKDGKNFVDVDFRPFGMVWDDNHETETSVYGIDFYKPHFGRVYGMINDDLGEKYERQDGGQHEQ